MSEYLLSVQDLHTSFFTDSGEVQAVNGVSFNLNPGEILGIVGESGSGKSVFVKCLMGLNDLNGFVESGSIEEVYGSPRMEYTQKLIAAIPRCEKKYARRQSGKSAQSAKGGMQDGR